jgi:cytochrome c biogenesis protein CcdA/thiol-disulfide isomerase/thioredoxin
MTLYLVAFAGGVLTILSPCILPVLPFVFARAGQSFRRSSLPLLVGMAATFAAVGSLAAVAGDWVVRANQYGRVVAMVVFAVLGVTLLVPALAEMLARPLVRLGAAAQREGERQPAIGGSLLLGVSVGLLWAPCAGPILGLILAGVALQGPGTRSALLLLAFGGGAACALALALLAGNRVFQLMKRSLGSELWIRRGLGVAVLAGVVGIALGWDTGVLARISLSGTGTATTLEQQLVDRVRPSNAPDATGAAPAMMMKSSAATSGEAGEGSMPPLDGAVQWLNGPPLTREGLRGKVVLIDFWTYSCINCLRAIPYVEAWAQKYKDKGLVVIGVHTPEFAFERDTANVARATRDLGLTYPVAVDSNRTIWTAFNNQYWPAHYLIDGQGRIRSHHFGEGNYDETERLIQQLLAEGHVGGLTGETVRVAATGAQAAPDLAAIQSPETYVGYERQENYVSPQTIARDRQARYTVPARLDVNQWALAGAWTVGGENATLSAASGKIVFRFHARDLHLVLGPQPDGKPVRFRVSIDGAPPLADHGTDVDAQGNGVVGDYRLYQLIRQKGPVEDRTFQIEFLDPGVQAFAFTFG